MKYSPEQDAIISLALPPTSKQKTIRVTAAAGTGKTTTLIGLSNRLIEVGHEKVTYVTFNRSAVRDAKSRLRHEIDCRTIHSAAIAALGLGLDFEPCDDSVLDGLILDLFYNEINNFLPSSNNSKHSTKKSLAKTVAFYIRKTLTRFLQSEDSESDGFDSDNYLATYYPAVLWHKEMHSKHSNFPLDAGDFYVVMAQKLYNKLRILDKNGNLVDRSKRGVINQIPFDVIIKDAQLHRARIDCTALLVDESQDCNASQIRWLQTQRVYGTHVAFVGDAVQTIYGFRGAKSEYLMKVPNCIDRKLTKSYRFGKKIGSVANTILFIKENSPQTSEKKKTWIPYRVVGGSGGAELIVTDKICYDREKYTIIGRTNISLFVKGIEILQDYPYIKLCINGDGESSGRKKYLSTFKELEAVFMLYKGNPAMVLKLRDFEDEGGLDWDGFKDIVSKRELSNYSFHIKIVETYQDNTMKFISNFKAMVLDKKYSAEEADVIVTTTHAAKGMEWPHVEVLNDFIPIDRFRHKKPVVNYNRGFGSANDFNESNLLNFEFHTKNWGDDVNLWYVAVTRAKSKLCISSQFMDLLRAFEIIIKLQSAPEELRGELPLDKVKIGHAGTPLKVDHVKDAYDLVCLWRDEMKGQFDLLSLELPKQETGGDIKVENNDQYSQVSQKVKFDNILNNDPPSKRYRISSQTPDMVNSEQVAVTTSLL